MDGTNKGKGAVRGTEWEDRTDPGVGSATLSNAARMPPETAAVDRLCRGLRRPRQSIQVEEPADPSVKAVLVSALFSLPPWFAAHQAAAVMKAKKMRIVFISARGGLTAMARLEDLLQISDREKTLAHGATPLPEAIPADVSMWDALRLMDKRGWDVLPVIGGATDCDGLSAPRVIVGVVLREDLLRAIEGLGSRRLPALAA